MNGERWPARDLKEAFVWRGDAGYEQAWAGMLFNELKPQRYPDVIVQAASEQDVIDAVRFARSLGFKVAVRAGGHSWVGSPVRDGGMLIDLSRLHEYDIDPGSSTATAQPGVKGRELAPALAEHGLAFPTGHCPTVALSGYILSGGLGWNPGGWGPACLNLQEVEAVTAAGEVVRCSEAENSDLFWAARGAGPGFFAVAIRYHLRLFPLPTAITASGFVFPLAEVEAVGRWVDEVAEALPPMVELSVFVKVKEVMVAAIAFADTAQEAARALEPFNACPFAERSLSRQVNEPTNFAALYDASATLWPPEHRYVADTLWSHEDLGTLLPLLGGQVASAPSEKSLVLAFKIAASAREVPASQTAFSVLGKSYLVAYSVWADPASDEANIRWLREVMRTVEPFGSGHYIAESDLTAEPSRTRRSYAPESWERLQSLRAQYDPDGLFHSYLQP